jgi:hypothetical protein
MKIAFIEYAFMFDTETGWQHLYQFDEELSKFFGERGFEAQIIKTVEGQGARRILYIKKKQSPLISGDQQNRVGRPQTLKGKIKELSDRPLRKPASEFDKKKLNLGKPMRRV